MLILDDYGKRKDLKKDINSTMVTNNGSGNTGSEETASICENIPCTDHRISTFLADMLTKKLTSTTDDKKKNYRFK